MPNSLGQCYYLIFAYFMVGMVRAVMTAGGKYFGGWSPLSYCTSQLFCRVILPFAGLHARFD